MTLSSNPDLASTLLLTKKNNVVVAQEKKGVEKFVTGTEDASMRSFVTRKELVKSALIMTLEQRLGSDTRIHES